MSPDVYFLFPKIVAVLDTEDTFSIENEILFNQKFIQSPNENFRCSESTSVLDLVPNLKNWIFENTRRYAYEYLGISQRLRFTQSWCVKHDIGETQSLRSHRHPNSIISGAYYVSATENSSELQISKDEPTGNYPYIVYEKEVDRPWLQDSVSFSVKTGRLILFPSNTNHTVHNKAVANEGRCVLAFNTWFDEPIGNELKYTKL
jgi:uncharacterized protein (TIGR02466 family)